MLAPGTYAPPAGRAVFGAIGDSAPDTWGRTLLRRAERLAGRSGIAAASARVLEVDGRMASIVRRFDRAGERRVPYLSAMAMQGRADGERSSFLEIADAIARYGAQADADRSELYRRLHADDAIDLEDGTCDPGLVLAVAPFFGLGEREARSQVGILADGVGAWRAVARDLGAGRAEIDRMASAFDHDDARAAARL